MMGKFIRNLGCFIIIIFVIFLFTALIFGGGKIREIGDKTTGIVKKAFHYAADKADYIQKSVFKKFEEMSKPFKSDEKKDIIDK
ncbi:MAG: hypothetical protein N2202_07845 [Proteobacteria bacterium]|nr:hypothetical protein [Pseudomonadota bacterium]